MTSRRTFIAGLALAPAAIAVPANAAISLACLPTADGSAWASAMARYEALKAEDHQFHTQVYHPTMDPINALSPPYKFEHVARNGHSVSYCVAGEDLAKHDDIRGGLWYAVRDELADARSKYAAWLDAKSKVGADALNEQSDSYGSALYEAERDLLRMPAPDLAALEWKVELLREQSADRSIEPHELAQIISDIRHLDGRQDL